MTRFAHFVVSALVFCLAAASHAGADPIVITGGSVDVPGGRLVVAPVAISGTRGFSLTGTAFAAKPLRWTTSAWILSERWLANRSSRDVGTRAKVGGR